MAPIHRQVFRGLRFFFIPNNTISQLRRFRVEKAREYGAEWVQIIEEATHVVVDFNLTFWDIETILNGDAGGAQKLTVKDGCPVDKIIVNDLYPSSCISARRLLDPSPVRFEVEGIWRRVPKRAQLTDDVTSIAGMAPSSRQLGVLAGGNAPRSLPRLDVRQPPSLATGHELSLTGPGTPQVTNSHLSAAIQKKRKLADFHKQDGSAQPPDTARPRPLPISPAPVQRAAAAHDGAAPKAVQAKKRKLPDHWLVSRRGNSQKTATEASTYRLSTRSTNTKGSSGVLLTKDTPGASPGKLENLLVPAAAYGGSRKPVAAVEAARDQQQDAVDVDTDSFERLRSTKPF